jgi:hypothetical protein
VTIGIVCGFEFGALDGREPNYFVSSGTVAISTTQVRTGAKSLRCNPASGASGSVTLQTTAGFTHFGLYIASMPSVDRVIFGLGTTDITIKLKSTGALQIFNGVTSLGTSSTLLTTGIWYWIGVRQTTGTSVPFLQINGVTEVTATTTVTPNTTQIGPSGTEASAIDIYIDDVVCDDTALLASSKVYLLKPISDNARGANWFCGNGVQTTALWDAVNNIPPAGVASASETVTTNIEHSGGATNAYDANLETYTTAGVASGDTVLMVKPYIRHGEDIATGTKVLNGTLVSNPAGSTSANFNAGNDGGAHGADPTGWVTNALPQVNNPSPTLGTSPVLRVNRPETASRVACVDFMGAYVVWQPAPPPTGSLVSMPTQRQRSTLLAR